jgi:hypothetical protein
MPPLDLPVVAWAVLSLTMNYVLRNSGILFLVSVAVRCMAAGGRSCLSAARKYLLALEGPERRDGDISHIPISELILKRRRTLVLIT